MCVVPMHCLFCNCIQYVLHFTQHRAGQKGRLNCGRQRHLQAGVLSIERRLAAVAACMPPMLINTMLEEDTSPRVFIKGYLCSCCQEMALCHQALICHNLLCCFCKSKHTQNSVQILLKNGQEHCVNTADAIRIGTFLLPCILGVTSGAVWSLRLSSETHRRWCNV